MEVIFDFGPELLIELWVHVHEWIGLGEGAGRVRDM